jgi:hypothetical protein
VDRTDKTAQETARAIAERLDSLPPSPS